MIRHVVPAAVREAELAQYLRRAWPMLPAHVLRDLLKKRDVRIDGVRCGANATVRGGETLEIYGDARYFAPLPELLFDDGKLLVCVKPQGLPSLPDADGVGADTMQARLQRVYPEARLCHRLDAATGGVMLAAADAGVESILLNAFKAHALGKRYRALLAGTPMRGEHTLRAHLTKDAKRASVRITDRAVAGSKEIVTRVRFLDVPKDGCWSAALEPVTGRTHQLRAHMAHCGRPILGDDKYGDRALNRSFRLSGRLCLWCETMELPKEAAFGEYAGLRFTAAPPEWLK